ncbi:hypothetical protein DRF75_01445 [Ehrlichia minasensis]|uniref:Uncharacterized protein n=1 Tax=Ehrlichia minasensis TaxID=1242993 RepID=A0A4Q6I6I6_9RICK|nr:hypothetical protein DRF75_01445 [Ehrlichia minasensis]
MKSIVEISEKYMYDVVVFMNFLYLYLLSDCLHLQHVINYIEVKSVICIVEFILYSNMNCTA